MHKILLVSIACPPKSDPESIQVGRYMKYLIRNGFDIEVVTSSLPTLYMEADKYFDTYTDSYSKIYSIKLFEFRILNLIIRKIFPSLLQYPDSKWSFYIKNPGEITKPDILYSRSYPISSTLLALKLKKKWGVPWLMHVSDPWAISHEGDSPATNFLNKPRVWNKKKEIECLTLAERISFTSAKTIDLYSKYYPQFKSKFILTPNVFDDEFVNTKSIDFSGKLRIIYTGGFGEKRDPSFLLHSIDSFLKENPSIRDKVEFTFTGPITRRNLLKFAKYKSIREVKHSGLVSYKSMIELQWTAHVLVNVDTDISEKEHSVFFPSKILEYIAARRRIVTIGNSHSVAHSIIKDTFGDCVEIGDIEMLTNTFSTYWQKFQEMENDYFTYKNSIMEYGAENNTLNLKKEIIELLK